MVFTSPRFLLFLAVVLAILGVMGRRQSKKPVLAVASCFFYAAWDWRYLGLLLFISVVDFWAAIKIEESREHRRRRAWLLVSIVSNLGLLAYFKYFNFFLDSANTLLSIIGIRVPHMDILLPAGISFYVFKTLSYTIDVYRRELKPCRSWSDYATFITFFPELIAGPIVRATVFLPQLTRDIGPTVDRLRAGAVIFLQGVVKKLLIADRMATIADPIFAHPEFYSGPTVWCGVLAYTIQIYCDFSGYSDMAIGTARMIGYDLPENFRMPYASTSIVEFWRRWHITLSTWLRDYLYIPLGGSRHGDATTYRNLAVTMLLGGLWHGASWNFVAWGGLHGFALVVNRAWSQACYRPFRIPGWVGGVLTFMFVMLAWVPFRAGSFETTLTMGTKMFGLGLSGGGRWNPEALWLCAAAVTIAHVIGSLAASERRSNLAARLLDAAILAMRIKVEKSPLTGTYFIPDGVSVANVYLLVLAALLVFFFAPMRTSPFIYFQF